MMGPGLSTLTVRIPEACPSCGYLSMTGRPDERYTVLPPRMLPAPVVRMVAAPVRGYSFRRYSANRISSSSLCSARAKS